MLSESSLRTRRIRCFDKRIARQKRRRRRPKGALQGPSICYCNGHSTALCSFRVTLLPPPLLLLFALTAKRSQRQRKVRCQRTIATAIAAAAAARTRPGFTVRALIVRCFAQSNPMAKSSALVTRAAARCWKNKRALPLAPPPDRPGQSWRRPANYQLFLSNYSELTRSSSSANDSPPAHCSWRRLAQPKASQL